MSINSRDYWEGRFREDWEQYSGPAQTRFFVSLAVASMPQWFKTRVRSAALDICDWGCAEGEGTALLQESLGVSVTGVDFAEEAIRRAREKFPSATFEAADFLAAEPEPRFDVLFSSNTLEHFHEPWSVFDRISGYARRYVALMLPYRELDRHPEHFSGFAPDTVPLTRNGWVLVHAYVVDAADIDADMWPGEQILAIYSRPEEIEQARLPLGAVQIAAMPEEVSPDDETLAPVRRIAAPPVNLEPLEERLSAMHADLVRAFSDDILRMQAQHEELLSASSGLQQQVVDLQQARDDAVERAQRAEQFGRWAAQVWGEASEQRQAMEALSDAVLKMEERLSHAISTDIQQMQSAHGTLLETASRVQAELAATTRELDAERAAREAAERRADASGEAMISLSRAVVDMEARVTTAISEDIQRMQLAHEDLLGTASRVQGELAAALRDLDAERAAREAAEQRAAAAGSAMELLSRSVVDMETRLSRAISEDIQRMQAAHAEVLEGRLRGELAAARGECDALAQRLAQAQAQSAEAMAGLADTQALLAQTQSLLDQQRATVAELETARARDRMEIARLAQDSHLLGEVLHSTSWRITRPLRGARRVLSNGFGSGERAALANWLARSRWVPLPGATRESLARRLDPGPSPSPQLLPAGGPEGEPAGGSGLPALAAPLEHADVFVWAVIDWHFRTQRPQHLARALAGKGHRVFYMSNNLVDASEAGFTIDDLDGSGRLFQVHLKVPGAPSIYADQPSPADLEALTASFASLLAWTGTLASVSIVQHPYWTDLAQTPPNARLVYDCMDHHAGFGDNKPEVLEAEHRLSERSDLVVVTSSWLHEELAPGCREVALIRNATDYEHFRLPPAQVYRDPQGRRIVGYIGAIAEWFDVDALRAIAEGNPDAAVVLVGADTAGVQEQLGDLPNVTFVGEVPYTNLPYWLHAFDVCLLPFRVIPLTLATNPVKIYEYLSAGKSVVATQLPEMGQFEGLIDTALGADDFARTVRAALDRETTADVVEARQTFAARQTWSHRAGQFDEVLASIREPKVSVVVLTYNNLAFTDACLFSVEAYSDYPHLEVIVVDNASSDGTQSYLREWVKKGPNRRIVLNDQNLGFSAGNNRGLEIASGDYIVLLNNDTYVTPGWVRTLLRHLRRDTKLGLVGPVTNNIGNEARIEIGYSDMGGMIEAAARYTRAHPGELQRIPVVAFFCVMMAKRVYEVVGGLDEQFGMGFFEDDDYCRRVAEAGWDCGVAEDVFVHHHLSASFDQLKAEKRQALFERNKALYEAKWGPWRPHTYRA